SSPARMGVIWLPSPPRILCFSFYIILTLLEQTTAERELKFVVAVFRHGDRTPIVNFPTDLHKESEWPQGFGQLTKTGMQQLFELGQYMKKRYSSFLNSTYNRQEFYIQSTDYDRTIMSAQSYLSGLFPPTSSQIWNPDLLWQPIPVHILQKATDRRLHFPLPDCPRFDELQNETQTSNEFQNRIQPYMDFLQTMAVNTGLELNNLKILDNFQLWNTYDTLHCEDIHNYTLPLWATKDVINKMEKLAELSLLSLFGLYKTEEKSRLQGGVLVNIILNSIKQAANSSKQRKMEVYSAHDTTIGALQVALNIFNGKLPPYAACQFFELYQESSGQVPSYLCKNKECLERYSIEMHYRNDSSKDPYLLTLPGCTSSCPLEKFAELVSPVITENWSKECGKKDKTKDIFIGFDVAVGLLFIFDLVLLYLLYHYGRCRNRNNYQDI
ncbi:PPAP phosphatase, partial [Galbula dea]|nr:PPAP phosphatase [Galbula dea]